MEMPYLLMHVLKEFGTQRGNIVFNAHKVTCIPSFHSASNYEVLILTGSTMVNSIFFVLEFQLISMEIHRQIDI